MKYSMKKISRKWVLLLLAILIQSSLGTKADLVEAKNLGQNGYKKYSDGMLIQWGKSSFSGSLKSVYLPVSYSSTDYKVYISFIYGGVSVISASVAQTYTSYFTARSRGVGIDLKFVETGEIFNWFSIGRWK